jgi:hypothetical protein
MFFLMAAKQSRRLLLCALILFLALPAGAEVQNLSVSVYPPGSENAAESPVFPAAYFTSQLEAMAAREAARPYWAATESELASRLPDGNGAGSLLLNHDILAFYGHPLSKNMGILGRYSKEELKQRLDSLAEEYRAAGGGREVLKAFYIIYGTVWPEGEIGILREAVLKEYVEYAQANDMLVFLDHQIGRYNPVDSLKRMLPWLRYPNVHLALDPEWRTAKPMKEIGMVTAEEINQAQKVMEEYMIGNNIPGERMLVIHQFNWRMISGRDKVQSAFQRVRLVHCADGFGSPAVKKQSYEYNARASNMPVKGFKLFYNSGISGAGYDSPLLSPEEVFALNPRPYLIMYQ